MTRTCASGSRRWKASWRRLRRLGDPGPAGQDQKAHPEDYRSKREAAVTARTDDYDAIVRVVQLYIDGFNDNNVGKFKEAFHEDA